MRGYLEADGYQIITAENGQIDLDGMNETEFALIVSDLDMPVMDGWEFLTRVREGGHQQEIRAMTLTALDSDKDRKRAKKCGFDRYEVRIEREGFVTSVAELLGLETKSKHETRS